MYACAWETCGVQRMFRRASRSLLAISSRRTHHSLRAKLRTDRCEQRWMKRIGQRQLRYVCYRNAFVLLNISQFRSLVTIFFNMFRLGKRRSQRSFPLPIFNLARATRPRKVRRKSPRITTQLLLLCWTVKQRSIQRLSPFSNL